jgi:TPR repeat protein
MSRSVVAAVLAAALLVPGCASYREKRANELQAAGEYERAMNHWTALAKGGNAAAKYHLGLMYAAGQGTRKDEDEAARWLREAARQGSTAAQSKLGTMYLAGWGHAEEDPDAERWLHGIAETGSIEIQYRVAVLFLKGDVVEEDPAELLRTFRKIAAEWPRVAGRLKRDGMLRPAAELGLAEAQHALGNVYLEGDGVPQSAREAAKWQYLAAIQDFAWAQLALGWSYGGGRGVPKDLEESARWFRRAAELGLAEAQYQLGLLYSRGLGVPADHVQAHKWFNLAAARNHEKAKLKRGSETDLLTLEELAEAEQLAVEWSAKSRTVPGSESEVEPGE